MGSWAIYGAGVECLRILRGRRNYDITIIDSYPEKYPEGVLGYKVYGIEKLKEYTSDDYVYITSTKYKEEIENAIRNYNKEVNIGDIRELNFLTNYREIIEWACTREDNYNVSVDVAKWLESALCDEMEYWESAVPMHMERGDKRFSKREFVYEYNPEIQFKKSDVILDVGSGPLPKFGDLIDGEKIAYFPVDPLAHQYKRLLKKHNIVLPVEPTFALLEGLSLFYTPGAVDYVIVNNALDHCIDIVRSVIECYKVLKPGGCLLLEHMEAEALHANYAGMHQWNITCKDNDLVVFNENSKINLTRLLEPFADVEVKRQVWKVRELIIVKIIKKKELSNEIINKYDDSTFVGEMINLLFAKLINKDEME